MHGAGARADTVAYLVVETQGARIVAGLHKRAALMKVKGLYVA